MMQFMFRPRLDALLKVVEDKLEDLYLVERQRFDDRQNVEFVENHLQQLGARLDAELLTIQDHLCSYSESQFSLRVWQHLLRFNRTVTVEPQAPPVMDLPAWSYYSRRKHIFKCSYTDLQYLIETCGVGLSPIDLCVYILRDIGHELPYLIVDYASFPSVSLIMMAAKAIHDHCTALTRLEIIGHSNELQVPWLDFSATLAPNFHRLTSLVFVNLPRSFSDVVVARYLRQCAKSLKELSIIATHIDGSCLLNASCLEKLVIRNNFNHKILAYHLCLYFENVNWSLSHLEIDVNYISLKDMAKGIKQCRHLDVAQSQQFTSKDSFTLSLVHALDRLFLDLRLVTVGPKELDTLIRVLANGSGLTELSLVLPFHRCFAEHTMRLFPTIKKLQILRLTGMMKSLRPPSIDDYYYHLGKMPELRHIEIDVNDANVSKITRNLQQIVSLKLKTVIRSLGTNIYPMPKLCVLDLCVDANYPSLLHILNGLGRPDNHLQRCTLRSCRDIELPDDFWQVLLLFPRLKTVEFLMPVSSMGFFYEIGRLPGLRHLSFLTDENIDKNYRHGLIADDVMYMVEMATDLKSLNVMGCSANFIEILEPAIRLMRPDLRLVLVEEDVMNAYELNPGIYKM